MIECIPFSELHIIIHGSLVTNMQSPLTQFYLIGLILGLAIYNSIILDVRFPPSIYKKLLGEPVGLADMAVSHPVCGGSDWWVGRSGTHVWG